MYTNIYIDISGFYIWSYKHFIWRAFWGPLRDGPKYLEPATGFFRLSILIDLSFIMYMACLSCLRNFARLFWNQTWKKNNENSHKSLHFGFKIFEAD